VSALILLAVVLALVAIGAPLFRRGLRTTGTVTLTILLDVSAALRAFTAASATAREATERMRASMEQLARDTNR
jgi:hypothetical protein